MSFGENLQFLRKRQDLTQENLAERMEVSRQTISKWEAGTSYPEMDKLLQLCEMFDCNMELMMRGNAEAVYVEDVSGYNKHMNSYIKRMTAGVLVLLAGFASYSFLRVFLSNENLINAIMMLFMLASVMIFVVSDLEHSHFQRKFKNIPMIYSEEEVDEFNGRKFPVLMAGGIAFILSGMIFYEILVELLKGSLGVRAEDAVNGIFMLLSAAVYLIGGFCFHGFGSWWVVFPIGGILCGVTALILKLKN